MPSVGVAAVWHVALLLTLPTTSLSWPATTRATLNAVTEAGGQAVRTDGTAITDTWWRLAWDITGTTPSFLFAAALGIG